MLSELQRTCGSVLGSALAATLRWSASAACSTGQLQATAGGWLALPAHISAPPRSSEAHCTGITRCPPGRPLSAARDLWRTPHCGANSPVSTRPGTSLGYAYMQQQAPNVWQTLSLLLYRSRTRPAAPQCGLHGMREPLNLLLRLRTFATHAAPPGAAVWRSPAWFVAQQSIGVCVTSCVSCHGCSQVARVRRLYKNLLPDHSVCPRLSMAPLH